MSEPALRIKVKVEWSDEPVLLRSIHFDLDGNITADYDSLQKTGVGGWYGYPPEFTIVDIRNVEMEKGLLSDKGDAEKEYKEFLKKLEYKK